MTTYGPEKWRKLYSGGASAALLALMVSSPAVAQDEDVSDASFEEPIEEIVTTGSRIKRTEFSSPAPVQILNMEIATLGGAQVLGRPDCGSLQSGKRADIAIWDVSGIEAAGSWDPVAALTATLHAR